ncbi:CASP-like protein 1F2 [Momordica charantia]|uniref:CASP-like protein n=1 Tax=Momordica charantia TaxID=3673 RepID=A0A6J1C084_MOMCH|nr:CASP-like protein 1F2 [Momordica charantia]XP_022134668.1 CASP-like protein 1F2 [Momordica charantia]
MADIELESNKSNTSHNLHLCSQTILRGLVIASTLAAAWLMLTAKQSVIVFGIPLDARYSYSPAFKFFALANAIACGFCFLSVLLLFVLSHRLHNQPNYILFLHDLLMMVLVASGCAASTAIGYVGKYGNSHTGWSPICDHFGKFCNRVTTSVAISYLAVICLLILTIISATKSASNNNNAH